MELTGPTVLGLVSDCLATDDEVARADPEVFLIEGVHNGYKFHRGRVAQHAATIARLLAQLPSQFQQNTGGGWTFSMMAERKDGTKWSTHPLEWESLAVLGVAANKVSWCLPRELWSLLPGGIPYLMVKAEGGGNGRKPVGSDLA